MFGFFKPKPQQVSKPKSSIHLWLDTAEEEYEFACNRRLTSRLAAFFQGKALDYLMHKIAHIEEDGEGLDTYKNTIFKKLKTKDGSLKYKKEVTYDDIRISNNVSVPLGTPYTEKWTLTDSEDPKVSDIQKC